MMARNGLKRSWGWPLHLQLRELSPRELGPEMHEIWPYHFPLMLYSHFCAIIKLLRGQRKHSRHDTVMLCQEVSMDDFVKVGKF